MDSKQAQSKDLMELNQLKYELPANVALAEEGSIFKKNNADQQTYTSASGTELIITLQSSTDFVYGPNCYLRMDIKADGLVTTAANDCSLGFLNSPATALFERFLLEDKSGAELERVEDINKAVRSILPWEYPEDYRRTCEMAGQKLGKDVATGADAAFAVNDPAVVGTGAFLRVCIPLWYFSGLFKEETLIPPSLISGAKFRLTLSPSNEALSIIASATGAVPAGFAAGALTYTISDPVIMMDSFSMASSVQRNIMEQMGSADGVPYTYQSLYNQRGSPGTQTDFVLQINKAVARAQKIYTSTQNVIADSASVDNLGSAQMPYFHVQSRVGDWYAPQQVLQLGQTDTLVGVQRNCAELFANNLQCTGGLRDPYHSPSVSLDDFRALHAPTGVAAAASNSGDALLVQTLNQSPHIGNAGISVNNSRTAEVRMRYASNAVQNKAITSFLAYVKVASVYPMRTIVKQ